MQSLHKMVQGPLFASYRNLIHTIGRVSSSDCDYIGEYVVER